MRKAQLIFAQIWAGKKKILVVWAYICIHPKQSVQIYAKNDTIFFFFFAKALYYKINKKIIQYVVFVSHYISSYVPSHKT